MRITACVQNDICTQFRAGFYYAYIIVTAVYIIILRLLPEEAAEFIAPLILFTDPSVLGMFFVGGIILLEKNDNILESLFVTPVRVHEYIVSKVVSLGLISLLSSICIVASYRGVDIYPGLLITGVLLTSSLFTMLGIVIASYAETVNAYMVQAMGYTFPLFIPLLGYFDVLDSVFYWVFPTHSSILLIRGAFHGIAAAEAAVAVGILILYNFAVFIWAQKSFARRTGR